MSIKKVLVISKTHLDIGFTDFSAAVVRRYMEDFIPAAMRTADGVRGSEAGFTWSTGSWLIYEYLRTQPEAKARALEGYIQRGEISWHGLPFTTHTELMTADLFRYGLSLSQELDRRFARRTVAAKMTDVPGHTRAMIPCLRQAGIEFLHIGVNPASALPDVPPLFRWRADSGETVTVMYQGDYGELTEIGSTGTALCFACAADNTGAQSPEAVMELFSRLRGQFPGAEIVAADLNDLALAVRGIDAEELPVVTDEIGDTWIHGAGSDPKKVCGFRGLSRLYSALPEGEDKTELARGLIMIPEHTWGMDEKTHLADNLHYGRREFEAVRGGENYRRMERSWQEQRAYLTDAVAALRPDVRQAAEKILAEAEREPAETDGMTPIAAGREVSLGGFTLRFDRQGEIDLLRRGERLIADPRHRLCTLCYEQFCEDDYKRFYSAYMRKPRPWSFEDFTKPDMHLGADGYHRYEPETADVFGAPDRIVVRYRFPARAHEEYGCPELFDLIITAEGGSLRFDLAWFHKPANRVAEGLWFGFRPLAQNKRIRKLGAEIDPKRVVRNGQRRLHATDFGVIYDGLTLETLDTALVAPQAPSLLNFCNDLPEDADGIHFNLYNNVWGTNFPMWYEENARFRFILNEVTV